MDTSGELMVLSSLIAYLGVLLVIALLMQHGRKP